MEERQMTIDDFLNNGNVTVMNAVPVKNTVDKVEEAEANPVEYIKLSKEELISIIDAKDMAVKNYEHELERLKELQQTELENMNGFYTQRMKELSNLNQYYERKLRLLKDIITIETGGEN